MKKMTLYVASPLGFSEAGRFFLYEKLLPLVRARGFDVLDPWVLTDSSIVDEINRMDPGSEKVEAWRRANHLIGRNNEEAIRRSNGLLAILDGSDVDSGTAAEIGFACALGKKVLGYRGDFRLAGDNEGSLVNIQVEYFIETSGGKIVTSLDDTATALGELFA